jgi:hypothetical protein
MMGTIVARKTQRNTYYVYQETHRVKVDPLAHGKTKGSGKSVVRTRSIYLGTAERILKAIQDKREPADVWIREFGLCAAAYQTTRQIGLPGILAKHLPGDGTGIPCWISFPVAILNRLSGATSKNKMGQWLSKTSLPDLLDLNPRTLTGKNFWYAVDDVMPQKLFEELKRAVSQNNELFLP